MEKPISRTPMQSDVDPLQFSPEFEVTIASRRADSPATSGYWIKDMRYTDPQWEPFPWEIEGFDFEPGFEARLLIRSRSPNTTTRRRLRGEIPPDEADFERGKGFRRNTG